MKSSILHIEDYDPEKGVDYIILLREEAGKNGLAYDWTDNLKDAKQKIDKNQYDFFVLDGQFPEEKGDEPDKKNFIKIYEYLIGKGIPKERIIVWSNSTTVHNYCHDNGITCFSKKEMKREDYIKKGNKPNKIVNKADADDIVKEICPKRNLSRH